MEHEIIKKLDLQINTTISRFELVLPKGIAFVEFEKRGNQYYLTHTEVPEELMGMGIGSILVEKVMNYLKNKGSKITPFCPYVKRWIEKHSYS